jgi:hypothetical protein
MNRGSIAVMPMESRKHHLRISRKAYLELTEEAISADMNRFHLFRLKAMALARSIGPRFNLSGDPLDWHMSVGISSQVWPLLVTLCGDLGVPCDAIGELVATYVTPEAIS